MKLRRMEVSRRQDSRQKDSRYNDWRYGPQLGVKYRNEGRRWSERTWDAMGLRSCKEAETSKISTLSLGDQTDENIVKFRGYRMFNQRNGIWVQASFNSKWWQCWNTSSRIWQGVAGSWDCRRCVRIECHICVNSCRHQATRMNGHSVGYRAPWGGSDPSSLSGHTINCKHL